MTEKEKHRLNLMNKDKEELVNIIVCKDIQESTDARLQTLRRRNEELRQSLRNQQANTENGFKTRDAKIKKLQKKIHELKIASVPGRTLELYRFECKKRIERKQADKYRAEKREKEGRK